MLYCFVVFVVLFYITRALACSVLQICYRLYELLRMVENLNDYTSHICTHLPYISSIHLSLLFIPAAILFQGWHIQLGEKTCFIVSVAREGLDQPSHPHSLISVLTDSLLSFWTIHVGWSVFSLVGAPWRCFVTKLLISSSVFRSLVCLLTLVLLNHDRHCLWKTV